MAKIARVYEMEGDESEHSIAKSPASDTLRWKTGGSLSQRCLEKMKRMRALAIAPFLARVAINTEAK